MLELVREHCKGKCEFYENCVADLEQTDYTDLDQVETEELHSVYQCMFDN